jgi:hypothetical protein
MLIVRVPGARLALAWWLTTSLVLPACVEAWARFQRALVLLLTGQSRLSC